MKQAIISRNGKKANPQYGDRGLLIIQGVFLDKTVLGDLHFKPLRKELKDVRIKLSSLKDIGVFWQKTNNIYEKEK